MEHVIEEQHGKLALANILSAVWLGDWDRYEEIFAEIPEEMKVEFPFHAHYERAEVELWYENHFFIPGDYFVSPYFSSYGSKGKDDEASRHDLLCLVGMYEKTAFYYPLETDRYPDHLGCLTAFIGATIQAEITALQNDDMAHYEQLIELEEEVRHTYIVPVMQPLIEESNKLVKNTFLKEFLLFYKKMMVEQWTEAI